MRRVVSFILAFVLSLSLFAQDNGALRYWNEVLDRYEQLCNACLEHRSSKEVKSRTSALQDILKKPVGRMTESQQQRFESIQKRYKGITKDTPAATFTETPLHIVQVDTVRRIEHLTVVDTVFVKEILGEVAILQQMSRRDTIVHIIRQEELESARPVNDTVYIERVAEHRFKSAQRPSLFLLAEAGILPDPSYGILLASGDRYGAYIKALDSFHHPETSQSIMSGENVWTTGRADSGCTMLTAGGVMQVLPWARIYAGAGYGRHDLVWEDFNGRWLSITDASSKGLAIDSGFLFNYQSLAFSIGITFISPRVLNLGIGTGIRF